MSGQVTGWVLRNGPKDRAMRAVLITIADASNRDGEHAHPGIAAMVEGSGYSRPSVFRALGQLVEEGWIAVQEEGGGRGKSTVYRVLMDRAETVSQRDPSTEETVSERSQPASETVSSSPGNSLILVPEIVPNVTTNGLTNVNAPCSPPFDAFWSVYPRKAEKQNAIKAFDKAVKAGTDPQIIVLAAKRYRDDPNREDAFTKYPASWLNGGCWTDDPLPPRVGSRRAEPRGFSALRNVQ